MPDHALAFMFKPGIIDHFYTDTHPMLEEIESKYSANLIWLIGAIFVLFQFFLQLSSGVVIGAIMQELPLSALAAGMLSSSFYIIYTGLQIPVGILFDHQNSRTLLALSALLCSFGCVVFASGSNFISLFCGRMIIGAGSSFAFVGLTHLLRQYFPAQRFAFLIGLSETLGFLATVLGVMGMGMVIMNIGWRQFIHYSALIALIIAALCWYFIPSEKKIPPPSTLAKTSSFPILRVYWRNLLLIFSNKTIWANGLFIGLSFSMVTVFGALWAVSFLQIKLHCSLRIASLINAMFFLGTGLSCPLFGGISNYLPRRPLILTSCFLTASLFLMLIYYPLHDLISMALLLFLIGLSCGAYILAYPIANELAPGHLLSTCAGFTNTLALITTPILQPLIGYFLDASTNDGLYSLANYQNALLVIPLSLICASVLVLFLPEKAR